MLTLLLVSRSSRPQFTVSSSGDKERAYRSHSIHLMGSWRVSSMSGASDILPAPERLVKHHPPSSSETGHGTVQLTLDEEDARFFRFDFRFSTDGIDDVVLSNVGHGWVGWASSFWEAREVARMVAVHAGLLEPAEWMPLDKGRGISASQSEHRAWVKERHPLSGFGKGSGRHVGAVLLDYEGGEVKWTDVLANEGWRA